MLTKGSLWGPMRWWTRVKVLERASWILWQLPTSIGGETSSKMALAAEIIILKKIAAGLASPPHKKPGCLWKDFLSISEEVVSMASRLLVHAGASAFWISRLKSRKWRHTFTRHLTFNPLWDWELLSRVMDLHLLSCDRLSGGCWIGLHWRTVGEDIHGQPVYQHQPPHRIIYYLISYRYLGRININFIFWWFNIPSSHFKMMSMSFTDMQSK